MELRSALEFIIGLSLKQKFCYFYLCGIFFMLVSKFELFIYIYIYIKTCAWLKKIIYIYIYINFLLNSGSR